MACQQCGRCCTYVALEIQEDSVPWVEMHGIPVVNEAGKQKVVINAPCVNHDLTNNTCLIHDGGQPRICKDYLCAKAKGEDMDLKDTLLERKAAMQADMNALAGAMQQIDWTLKQLEDEEGIPVEDIVAAIESAEEE